MLTGNEIQRLQERNADQFVCRVLQVHELEITPFNAGQVNPNSYNLRLGPTLGVYPENLLYCLENSPIHSPQREMLNRLHKTLREHVDNTFYVDPGSTSGTVRASIMDTAVEPTLGVFPIPPEGVVLVPGILYLGHTVERTYCRGLAPVLEGRSSVARLGIEVHKTAGFGDNGFDGEWTLEISVMFPLRVYVGIEICQVSFEPTNGVQSPIYAGKYQGQTGPRKSGWWKDVQADRQESGK